MPFWPLSPWIPGKPRNPSLPEFLNKKKKDFQKLLNLIEKDFKITRISWKTNCSS
jgi:hypothetical protein